MTSSTSNLVLDPDTVIDLQLHTIDSDGQWTPEQLLDYLKAEGFGLAAITDHDRVETMPALQQLSIDKQMPLLIAAEMTTTWHGGITDILCYGFDPASPILHELAQHVLYAQQENTREVFEQLSRHGYADPAQRETELADILAKPAAQQPHALFAHLEKYHCASPGQILMDAGFALQTNDTSIVVDAVHRSGGVCVVAHPGRSDGFICYDQALLDKLHQEVPFDGLEVYYPVHTPAQIAMYQAYAQQHNLLVSAGSDSHGPAKPPIKYNAALSRALLERIGILFRT